MYVSHSIYIQGGDARKIGTHVKEYVYLLSSIYINTCRESQRRRQGVFN